jgi:hypothetical protein
MLAALGERYRYRGAQIATPFNIDVIDPAGARFRSTGHDDVAFVGQVSELVSWPVETRGEPGAGTTRTPGSAGGDGKTDSRNAARRPVPDPTDPGVGPDITRQAIRRGTFNSVDELIESITAFINGWNDRCHPFVWTKDADTIIARAPQTNFRHGTLAAGSMSLL